MLPHRFGPFAEIERVDRQFVVRVPRDLRSLLSALVASGAIEHQSVEAALLWSLRQRIVLNPPERPTFALHPGEDVLGARRVLLA